MSDSDFKYTVLSGGVGGAKLVLGLHKILAPEQLSVVVNTGDDFEHLGLPICPDIDTLIYTLAGTVNPTTGWGLNNESWYFMEALKQLGGATWFSLGDRDLATHIRRRDLLVKGQTLSEATLTLLREFHVHTPIIPMSNTPVRTKIKTNSETLDFQDYFVRLKAEPAVTEIIYAGNDQAAGSPDALAALQANKLGAIILTPSNPWLSIDPILSLSDIKSTITNSTVPVVGISPIVSGKAIKGPTAKLMRELGMDVSAYSIAEHYKGILDGLIIDQQDADQCDAIRALGLQVSTTNTIMNSLDDKKALAEFTLAFARQIHTGNMDSSS
ncbi:MAG: 2-phospho-L-lactate transferase [Gammaproteobacteria bacterium]|nr:2-phospho-L-lactate transferase [Gammaproteobacteria bacterium]MCP4090696.1 2-phospho-L-lactate transferase [Gammaproteobacteria bacterium]MCP4277123.1 2-phospho-L-lactate transferase [Gammaproteobacteria bacterium]MCP4832679.1 2-phospho-L-lactate transferase [Gammaproteobacteria bacterium]MCP4928067.1 2-phospho-L-lactate transferase [Gammaproteobacteria bacterium]